MRQIARRLALLSGMAAAIGVSLTAAAPAPKESFQAMAAGLGAVSRTATLVGGVATGSRVLVERAGARPVLQTLTTFRVDSVLQGGDLPQSITVLTQGGVLDGVRETVAGQSQIRSGVRSVLALQPRGDGTFGLAFGGGVAVDQATVQCPQAGSTPGTTPGWCNEGSGILPTTDVPWEYDPTDEPFSGALATIQAAFDGWVSVSSAHPGYRYAGTVTGEPHDTQAVNLVSWAANGYDGCSYTSASGGCAGQCMYWSSGTQILNFDIWFNIAAVTAPDLPITALHEIGHSLGLAHINDAQQVMEPVNAGGTNGGLGQGDINGEVALYGGAQTGQPGAGGPAPAPADPPGTLQCGTSTAADAPDPAPTDHTAYPLHSQTKPVVWTSTGNVIGRVTVNISDVSGGRFWSRVFSRRLSLPAGTFVVTTCLIVESASGSTIYTQSVHRTRHSTHAFRVRPLILKHTYTRPGTGSPDVVYGWIVVLKNGSVVARSAPATVAAT